MHLKQGISKDKLVSILNLRTKVSALKTEIKTLETLLYKKELDVLSLYEQGCTVPSGFELVRKLSERRYPSWRSAYSELAGEEATNQILASTPPTISIFLVIAEVGVTKVAA